MTLSEADLKQIAEFTKPKPKITLPSLPDTKITWRHVIIATVIITLSASILSGFIGMLIGGILL